MRIKLILIGLNMIIIMSSIVLANTLTLKPQSDYSIQFKKGDTSATSNAMLVNDSVYTGNKYVYSDTQYYYKRDFYNMWDHNTETGTITNVQIRSAVGQWAQAPYIKLCVYTHSSGYCSGDIAVTDNTWSWKSYDWANNPNTGNAWTWQEIDDVIPSQYFKSNTAGYVWSYQFEMIVTYTPSSFCDGTTNCVIDCSSTNTMSGNVNMNNYNITLKGTGEFSPTYNMTNIDYTFIHQGCNLTLENGVHYG